MKTRTNHVIGLNRFQRDTLQPFKLRTFGNQGVGLRKSFVRQRFSYLLFSELNFEDRYNLYNIDKHSSRNLPKKCIPLI